jgi:hypothetical protein
VKPILEEGDMSKTARQGSWLLAVAMLAMTAFGLGGLEVARPAAAAAATSPGTAVFDLEPAATCSSIKCPPGQVCVDVLVCDQDGGCYHVGRCVSLP